MTTSRLSSLVVVLACAVAPALPADDPPRAELLKTNTLDFPARGALRLGFAVTYLQGVEIPFSGLAGNLTQWGVLRGDAGVSDNVAVQVRGILYQDLHIDAARSDPVPPVTVTGRNAYDVGDFSVATLVRVAPERRRRPGLGLRFELKLPNTDDTDGIGTNTTDVFLALLLEKRFGRFRLFSDTGIGILSEPTVARSQNDVVVYGLGSTCALSSGITLMSEVNGRWAPSGSLPGTEDQGQLRAGLSWRTKAVTYEMLLTRGLNRGDENFGVALDVSLGVQVFHRR
jgi:hypothetical protein